MHDSHDLAIFGLRRNFQFFRHGLPDSCQGMISGCRNGLFHPLENRAVRVECHHGLLAVHELRRIGDRRAKGFTDGLMTKADAKDGNLFSQFLCRFDADACVLWKSGTR